MKDKMSEAKIKNGQSVERNIEQTKGQTEKRVELTQYQMDIILKRQSLKM